MSKTSNDNWHGIAIDDLLESITPEEELPLGGGLTIEQQRRIEKKIFMELHEEFEKIPDANSGGKDNIEKIESLDSKAEGMAVIQKRKLRKRMIFVLAAAIIAVFGVSTIASKQEQWDGELTDFMGIDDVNTIQVDDGHVDMNVSSTCIGTEYSDDYPEGRVKEITMTATESIGDKQNLYIRIDTNYQVPEDFNPETDYIQTDDFSFYLYNKEGGENLHETSMFTSDCEDGTLSFFINITTSDAINKGNVQLNFEDLYWYHDLNQDGGEGVVEEKELLYEGSWELAWKYNYKSVEKVYRVNQVVNADHVQIRVTKVAVKPLGIHIYGYKCFDQWNRNNPNAPFSLDIEKIIYDDGTVLEPLGNSSQGIRNRFEVRSYTDIQALGVGLDVKKVESIVIDGQEIKLK